MSDLSLLWVCGDALNGRRCSVFTLLQMTTQIDRVQRPPPRTIPEPSTVS